MNNHLDFDTDFLDNSASGESRPSAPKSTPPPEGGGSKKGWIIAAVVIGVLILIGSMEGSSSSSSTYTPTTKPTTATQNQNNKSLSFGGETFSCSDYHYDKAIALQPSTFLSNQIDSEGAALDIRISNLDAESIRVDNMYVDEYSQYSIDNYNAAIESYNLKNTRLQTNIDSWNIKNASLNRKIDVYNNYLDNNCRPR
jgi:hypothetical protein